MRFASSITEATDARRAVDELLEPVDSRLTRGMVDLALLFITKDFKDHLADVIDRIGTGFPGAVLLGCTAQGTIGFDKELERVPSMSLLVASMPNVEVRPFYMRQSDLESIRTPLDWERIVGVSPESRPTFVALADPFRLAIHDFIDQINEAYPGSPLVGGVASAARMPQQNRLILNGDTHREGIVGIALTGLLAVDTVVSQGCRPIGKPFVITKAERNVIRELGGRAALEQLQNVLARLSREDERLVKQSLFVGRVIDEYKDRFTRGDFLIHNIIGVDRHSGAVAISGHARIGATVQFHVRDAASADEDLRKMLSPHADTGIRGALLFGCNGRGTQMWPEPGHDVGVLRELLGDVPVAGFFCGGEFGPIGGANFIHGFTASIALFRQPDNRLEG
ncbi:MAG: FIST C-terminal domain-containing protein [Phycisphaerales bacterium]|nr:MAG: FIST C-terminal domain-containing protein [Phycisphaerales bacterium]